MKPYKNPIKNPLNACPGLCPLTSFGAALNLRTGTAGETMRAPARAGECGASCIRGLSDVLRSAPGQVPFIHFIHSFIHFISLIHSFNHSLFHSLHFIHSFIHSFISFHSFTHSLIHSFIHSLFHYFTHFFLITNCHLQGVNPPQV